MPSCSVRLRRSRIVSSTYHAPKRLLQPSSLGFGHHLETCSRFPAGTSSGWRTGLPKLPRSGVFVILQPLEPDSRADLMNALGDLDIVRIGEQISAIPDIGGVVRAGRRDRRRAGGGDAAADRRSRPVRRRSRTTGSRETSSAKRGSKLNAAREKPARNVFSICGEKTCVSCRLATWLRSVR